jgi:hypothetical protein
MSRAINANVNRNANANRTVKNKTNANRNQATLTRCMEFNDRISNIEDILITLNNHMITMQKYTKLESDFQEHQNISLIAKLYLENHPYDRIDVIHVTKCYPPNGHEITDVDGLLLARNDVGRVQHNNEKQRNMKNRWNTMYPPRHQTRNASSHALNRMLQSAPSRKHVKVASDLHTLHYLLIESKHGITKGKVDKKMKQIKSIHEILRGASSASSTVQSYHSMIKQMLFDTHLSIDQLDYPIELIFSSDDVSASLAEYIVAIHDGMTEETYDRIVHQLLFEDKYMMGVVEMITAELKKQTVSHKSHEASVSNKSDVNRATNANREAQQLSMREIREMLLSDVFANKRAKYVYMIDYITPFSELEDTFRQMRHHVGALQMNRVLFSSVFRKATLNHND